MRGRTLVRLTAAAAAQQTQTVSRLWWCLRCLLRSTGSQSSLPQVSRPRRTSCIRSGVARTSVPLFASGSRLKGGAPFHRDVECRCPAPAQVRAEFFVLVRAFSPSRQIVQPRGCTAKCRGATHHPLSHRRRRGQDDGVQMHVVSPFYVTDVLLADPLVATHLVPSSFVPFRRADGQVVRVCNAPAYWAHPTLR